MKRDEPNKKATFSVSAVIPKDRTAISNMPISFEKETPDGRKKVSFEESPKMSSYLLALVVGEFDYVEDKSTAVTIRVYTPVGKSEQGLFGLEVAKKALPHYEEWFDLKYPLSKLDLISIPDFAAGAMEVRRAKAFSNF